MSLTGSAASRKVCDGFFCDAVVASEGAEGVKEAHSFPPCPTSMTKKFLGLGLKGLVGEKFLLFK